MKNLKFILFVVVHLVFLVHPARAFYDPTTGQFLSREPLGENESLNLYTYGHNDPINNVDVLGLQAVSVTSQQMSDNLRSKWLLALILLGNQHPESPEATQTRGYADYFGLTKPFTDADYERAAGLAGGLIMNHGRPSVRTPSWQETELARQPAMMPYVAPPAVQTAALSIGAPSSSAFYADMNAPFLLPIGAEGFVFSGALSGLRIGGIMATGASLERAVLLTGMSSELRTGAMLARTAGSNSSIVWENLVQAGLAAKTPITPSAFARSQQGVFPYTGVDRYRDIILKKGTIIYGGEPGQSAFYTAGSAFRRVGDSATDLWRGLQVEKHATKGYRMHVTAYEVIDDIPAAFGRALMNGDISPGGLPQVVVPNFRQFLRPIYTAPLSP